MDPIKAEAIKLDELQLHGAKPMPTKLGTLRNPPLDAPSRRSVRIAELQKKQPDYRPAKARRKEPKRYATDEQRADAIKKAKKLIEDQLGSDHPTFIRPISCNAAHKSTALIIPVHFSQHLPAHARKMVLVGEVDKQFDVFFRIDKKSGNHITRWRAFAADHELDDGDCCVFQLIEETKFKVHIIRADKNDH